MEDLSLTRFTVKGVTLLGNGSCRSGVTLAFSERAGGVSEGAYASLNLGYRAGDDPAHVDENIARLLEAAGASGLELVHPRQVHSARIVPVLSAEPGALAAARAACEEGADGVVCTAPGVAVLLLAADCALVCVAGERGFALVHSGRPGSEQRIAAHAVRALAEATGEAPETFSAFVGPHIQGPDYEVGEELVERFAAAFGDAVRVAGKPLNLDFGAAVRAALEDGGVRPERIWESGESTYAWPERYFSYRRDGRCGRHGAIAYLAA